MYVVTGGAGFIGSNIVRALNERSIRDVLVVDNLGTGEKSKNIVDCQIADYLDKREFLRLLEAGKFVDKLNAIIHQGACSDTMERNSRYMMENNYEYSKSLLHFCQQEEIPLIYASSASVYGAARVFAEAPEHEAPLNIYAYSKLLFDQYVRSILPNKTAQVVGLRYFNTYGMREQHKGHAASVAFHFFNQYRDLGRVKLFHGSGGYDDGEQQRDFVWVDDAVNVNLFFLDHPDKNGIFNVGTGHGQSFNDVARAVINSMRRLEGKAALPLKQLQSEGFIEYIDFPSGLRDKYQSFTQADMTALRAVGFTERFRPVEEGVERYVQKLLDNLNDDGRTPTAKNG